MPFLTIFNTSYGSFMNFIKFLLYFNFLLIAFSANAEEVPPFYTESKTYNSIDNYCFPQGVWSGDLENLTIHYHLIATPEDQNKYGDIFLGVRQKTQPERLWLFGFSMNNTGFTTPPNWIQYDNKQKPMVYAMGQSISAITKINIISKAINLRQFEGDGEILIGYGLRNNEYTTSPIDSFNEMNKNNRFKVIWKFDSKQPMNFGNWTCISYKEVTQQIAL